MSCEIVCRMGGCFRILQQPNILKPETSLHGRLFYELEAVMQRRTVRFVRCGHLSSRQHSRNWICVIGMARHGRGTKVCVLVRII